MFHELGITVIDRISSSELRVTSGIGEIWSSAIGRFSKLRSDLGLFTLQNTHWRK